MGDSDEVFLGKLEGQSKEKDLCISDKTDLNPANPDLFIPQLPKSRKCFLKIPFVSSGILIFIFNVTLEA